MFLTAITRRDDVACDPAEFPWSLPLLRTLEELQFTQPVTFLVGENGSGKSTLLEGIAAGMQSVAAGSRDLSRDPSLAAARRFAAGFRFARRGHARPRLFLRAEDVFGYTTRLGDDMRGLSATAAELEQAVPDGHGRRIAVAMAEGQRLALERRYGADPDARSHGETFLALLGTRLVPNGLYFLDEPEAPLSPSRVLALMALLLDRVAQGCQFVVATHSPILLALPQATILLLEDGRLQPCAWQDLEHVRVTRAFLNDPQSVLRHLADDGTR